MASDLPSKEGIKERLIDETNVNELTRRISTSLDECTGKCPPTMGEYKLPNVQPMDLKARGLVKGDGIASVHSEAVHNAPNYRTKERYLKRKEHGIQRNYLYNLGQSTNGAWKTARLGDRKSTRLNSSHSGESRMPSSA